MAQTTPPKSKSSPNDPEALDIPIFAHGPCRDCAIKNRCNHHCACLNFQSTGDFHQVSPVLCRHERIVLPIADKLAERLYRKHSGAFLQKQYNDMYPVISYVEDTVKA